MKTQHQSTSDSIQHSNQYNSLLDKSNISHRRRSLSLKRARSFNNRNVARCSSISSIHSPSSIDSLPLYLSIRQLSSNKNAVKQENNNSEDFPSSSSLEAKSYINKMKLITSRSMMKTKNMRLPPTATVIVNQTSKPSILTTTTVNKTTCLNKKKNYFPYRCYDQLQKPTRITNFEFDLLIKSCYHHTDNKNSYEE